MTRSGRARFRRPRWSLPGATALTLASGVGASLALGRGHFALGGGLLLLSVALLRWPRSIWAAGSPEELRPGRRRLGVLLVCALAVFFRAYRMTPPGLWGDDAINGLLAFGVLDGRISSPFELVAHSYSKFHALSNYPIAAAFWALGPGLVSLRLPGVIAGLLAVPLLYGAIAPLFGARTALVAAWFFASSPLQISHSKGLVQVVFGEFFQLLGLCLLVRGVAGSRRWLTVAAAAPLALCVYTYHSAKLAPLVAMVYLTALVRGGERPRPRARHLEAAAAVFLLGLIPAVISYAQLPSALTERMAGTALWPAVRDSGSLWPLWDSVWRTLLIFHYRQGPTYHWFGIGTDPAFNVILAFLLAHGLVESLRRWRESRHVLLLAWVLVGLIPGVLSTEAPRPYRILLATPPLYVWAAMPLVQLWRSAAAAPARRWVRGVLVLLALAVPFIDFNYYFYRVYTSEVFRWSQAERMVEMARALRARGPGWTGYVLSDRFPADHETFAFLSRAWRLEMRDVSSLAEVLPLRRRPEGGALFMMSDDALAAGAALRSFYPEVALEVRRDPPPRTWWLDRWLPPYAPRDGRQPTVAFLAVSRAAADAIGGVTVTFVAADGTPVAGRTDARLRLDEPPAVPAGPTRPAAARWSGSLHAPRGGAHRFVLESGAEARVWIDGDEVVSSRRPAATRVLAEGLHRFAAEATIAGPPVLRVRWQPPGGREDDIPAARLFRRSDVHGLLAEYQGPEGTVQRIEPYPYYSFFPETFPGPFSVRWRGRLHVPAPGSYRFEPIVHARVTVRVDGRVWQPEDRLPAGALDLEMVIEDVSGAARLRLYWEDPTGKRELIPPDAFSPPP